MKRLLALAVLLSSLVLPVTAAPGQEEGLASSKFALVATGATAVDDATTRLLLDVKDGPKSGFSLGRGAASLIVTAGEDAQTARGRAYFSKARLDLRFTYTTAAPDPDGTSAITGSGRITAGRGKNFRKATGTFAVTGSQSATGAIRLRLAGTVRYVPILTSGRGH